MYYFIKFTFEFTFKEFFNLLSSKNIRNKIKQTHKSTSLND